MRQCLKFLLESERIAPNRISGMAEKELNIFYDEVDTREVLSDVENRPGIYVIVGKSFKYPYPKGDSGVIYIGTSEDLHARLAEHIRYFKKASKDWKTNETWADSRYNYILSQNNKGQGNTSHGNTRVYILYTHGEKKGKDLESRAIEAFYDKYRAIPVGNGARSFRDKE